MLRTILTQLAALLAIVASVLLANDLKTLITYAVCGRAGFSQLRSTRAVWTAFLRV